MHTHVRSILRPPDYVRLDKIPSVFLIGPIQGAPDWQGEAVPWLAQRHPGVHLFSPRSSMWKAELSPAEKKKKFAMQVEWEHVHISHTIRHGVIVAWMPLAEEEVAGRSYAQTTRFEVGFLYGQLMASENLGFKPGAKLRMAVGADPRFPGRGYMQSTLGHSGLTIHESLLATLEEASSLLGEMGW